jgi:hypothetical protein
MELYKYRASATNSPDQPPPLASGMSWAKFGSEFVLYGDTGAAAAGPQRSSRGARLAPRSVEATRDELFVVVQNGRLFQQHHPEVAVLHDRGRFLLVRLSPDRARQLASESRTCFGVRKLKDNQVVFDERAAAPRRRAPVAFVAALVESLSRDRVKADLEQLVGFGTRHSTGAGHAAAVQFAKQRLDAAGYATRTQQVTVGAGASANVIADKAGAGQGPRKVVLVTAHLDSINLAGGPSAPAPGADDNGTGSAGVLEIARAFQAHRASHDLRLILFGGEEQGLFGSQQYVASLAAAERSRIAAVVNMDMTGSLNTAAPAVLLEGAPVSQAVIDGLADSAATYTTLTVETSLEPFASDHVPFIEAQVPAVLTIEGADRANDTVHSAGDVLDRVDYDLLLAILRMNVGYVASVIGQAP